MVEVVQQDQHLNPPSPSPSPIYKARKQGSLGRNGQFQDRVLRSQYEQVAAAGGGDLERPLGAFLALDVGEVGLRRARCA